MLQDYDIIPKDMRAYLRNYGRHFNRKACEWAVRQMRRLNKSNNRIEPIEPLSKEHVDDVLKRNGITLANPRGYDYVYIANMAMADFYGSSIADESHLALYIKDVVDDVDADDGLIFNRWLADCDTNDIIIDWSELI